VLRAIKGGREGPEAPYNCISLDSEADSQGVTYVWCVAGYYRGKEIRRVFHGRAEVVKYLFHRKWYRTILTGVNLAYDLNTLYAERLGFTWDTIVNMGKLITASPPKNEMVKRHFRDSSEYLKIMDLGNFVLNTSLKGMADMLGIDGHIDKHILGVDGDEKELTEACMSHAMTGVKVYQALEQQIHGLGGSVKLTGPSTALDLYRRKYLKPEFEIWDQWAKGEDTETREAREKKIHYMKDIGKLTYVGGRTEAFRLGLFNHCDYLDINSSYSYQMSIRDYPDMNTYKRYTKGLSADFLASLMAIEEGQAYVEIKAPKKMLIPFLHTVLNGKLIFPLGTLRGWYTYPEIRYALELGYKIVDVVEIASFRRIPSPFTGYVNELVRLKVQPRYKQAAKLMLNGLSGKFGQREPDDSAWSLVEYSEDIKIDNKRYFSIQGQIWEFTPPESHEIAYKDHAYPLLIAYVTAWGRIQEHKTIMAIGPEHVHYMDTDSIIGDRAAVQKAISEGKIWVDKKALGAYDLEHEDITVQIRGPKYYRYHERGKQWVYHIKGVPSRVAPDHWLHSRCAYYRPRKIKTALRTGTRVNEFIRVYHEDRSTPDKRVFIARGRESNPLKVS